MAIIRVLVGLAPGQGGEPGAQVPVQVPTPVGVPTPVLVPNAVAVQVPVGVQVDAPIYITQYVEENEYIKASNIPLTYSGDAQLGEPVAEFHPLHKCFNTAGEVPVPGDLINSWYDLANNIQLTAGSGAEGTYGEDEDHNRFPYVRFQSGDGLTSTAIGSQFSGFLKPCTMVLVCSFNSIALNQRFMQVGVASSGNASLYLGTDTLNNEAGAVVFRGGYVSDSASSASLGNSNSFQKQLLPELGKKYIFILTTNGENIWLYAASEKGYVTELGLAQDCQIRTLSKFSLGSGLNTSGIVANTGDINVYHAAIWNKCLYDPQPLAVSLANSYSMKIGEVPRPQIFKRPTYAYVFRPNTQLHVDIMNSGQNFQERDNTGTGDFFVSESTGYSGSDTSAIKYDSTTASSTARLQIDALDADPNWRADIKRPRMIAARVKTPAAWGTRNRYILASGSGGSDAFRLYFNTSGNLVFQHATSAGSQTVQTSSVFLTNTWYQVYAGYDGDQTIFVQENMEDPATLTNAALATPPASGAKDVKLMNDSGANDGQNEGALHWLCYWHNYVLSLEERGIAQTCRFHGGLGGGIQASLPLAMV